MSKGRIVAILVSGVLGLSLGGLVGLKLARNYSDLWEWTQTNSAQHQLALSSALNFSYADPEHARAAVVLEIDTLKELQRAQPGFDVRGSLAIAYVRLAVLDQRLGNQHQTMKDFAEARSRLGTVTAARSDSQLEDSIKFIDAKLYAIP